MGVSSYKIKKWYRMLTGQSIDHVNQGVGTCYSKSEIAGYYNDLTEKVTKDDPSILVPKYHVETGEELFFSIGIFQYGLAAYDLYLKTKDEKYKEKVLACADWAVQNQQEDGSWPTFAHENPKHPYSSMAQGEACSLLLRARLLVNDQKYYSAAKKAVDFMLIPLREGGTTEYVGEDVYLYEFTEEPLVLNGWIFSYWGLRDFAIVSQDENIQKTADKTVKTILKALPQYDTGYWSRYDLTKRIASPFYHKLHIAQMKVMYELTAEETFKEYAMKWETYGNNPICKSRAFIKKVVQKIFEKETLQKENASMWTKKKKIRFILYMIFASWLPRSQRSKLAKRMRVAFARKVLKHCGKDANIERNAFFTPDVSVGDRSSIGVDCEVYGPVTIGNDVMMGPECVIYTSGHRYDRTDITMIEQGSSDVKPVSIGDDTWLGRRVMIMPGVKIGKGCVIGAGAVVTKDIPDYSVAGGVPAKVIKSRI